MEKPFHNRTDISTHSHASPLLMSDYMPYGGPHCRVTNGDAASSAVLSAILKKLSVHAAYTGLETLYTDPSPLGKQFLTFASTLD